MTKGIKHPSPLRIDMGFKEALERFIQTDAREVEESIKRSKQRKPPGGRKHKPSGGNIQSDTVVSLRDRRMRKRNKGA